MKSRWKIFAGVAITAMALSACSAPTDDGTPADATLVVGMTYAPKTLNPNYVTIRPTTSSWTTSTAGS